MIGFDFLGQKVQERIIYMKNMSKSHAFIKGIIWDRWQEMKCGEISLLPTSNVSTSQKCERFEGCYEEQLDGNGRI